MNNAATVAINAIPTISHSANLFLMQIAKSQSIEQANKATK
jgi:hypothetical protein